MRLSPFCDEVRVKFCSAGAQDFEKGGIIPLCQERIEAVHSIKEVLIQEMKRIGEEKDLGNHRMVVR